jgi:flagellar hook assembly protein FlgD
MKSSSGQDLAILFCANEDGRATLKIFNSAGEKIQELFNGYISPGAQYQVFWDGKNMSGQKVASGIYLIHLTLPGSTRVAKVAVTR